MKSIVRLIKNKNFLNLWSSQTLTQLEASIVDYSILIYVTEIYKSVFATALIFALQNIPALPVSLISGIVGDFYDRRKILIFTNAIRVVILVLLILTKSEAFWLYLLIFIFSIIMFIYSTAETATIKNVVEKEDLVSAATIFSITINATTLIGAVFSVFLYNALGGSTNGGLEKIFIIGAVLFALATFSSRLLPKNINSYEHNVYVEREPHDLTFFVFMKNLTKYIRQTLKFITTTPSVTISLLHTILLQAGMFSIASVAFKFAEEKLGVGTEGGSIYVIIPAVFGLLLGAIFSQRFAKKNGARYPAILGLYIVALSIMSIALLTMLFSPAQIKGTLFWLIEVLIVLAGFGATFSQLPAQTVIHHDSDDTHRSRVFGILNGGTFTMAGILLLFVSPLGDLLGGVSQFFFVLGLLSVIYALVLAKMSRKIPKTESYSW